MPFFYKRKGRLPALIAILILGLCMRVGASNSTAYTYTLSAEGEWIRTQDAYLVGSILLRDAGLNKPEDIFVFGNNIYIADTGNGRIVVFDRETNGLSEIRHEGMQSPYGIYVNSEAVYAADPVAVKIFKLSHSGELLQEFERPKEATFGSKTSFKPKKVTVTDDGTLFVVSEGSYDGIIQLSSTGQFLGYFGYNNIRLSLLEQVQDLIFTEEQKQKLFRRVPKTFYNLAADGQNMIYSITKGVEGDAVKKHNIAGYNMFDYMADEANFEDITIGSEGQVLAVTETGLIYEYSNDGDLLFSFGGRAISSERNGLFTVASGIAVDGQGCIYVLDKEQGILHFFYPTAFALKTHQAILLYNQGKYHESLSVWQDLLRQSGNSRLAHNGIAKCYTQMQEYELAAEHFRIAENRKGYSDCFWELRNQWLGRNIPYLGAAAILVFIVLSLLQRKQRKVFSLTANLKTWQPKPVADLLIGFRFLKHPFDSYYSVRHEGAGNYLSSTILFLLAYLVFMFQSLGSGFIFNFHTVNNTSVAFLSMLFLIPLFLGIICNFMVTEIIDGEGRFRDVYNTFAYALIPFILFSPVVTVISHVVTYNETFLLEFGLGIIYIWCFVLLVIGLREINGYEYGQVLWSLILTVFLMCIVILVVSMIGMFWEQIGDLVYTIAKEVGYRVGG